MAYTSGNKPQATSRKTQQVATISQAGMADQDHSRYFPNKNLLGRDGDLNLDLGYYNITEDKENIVERVLNNISMDREDVSDLIDATIWELLPKPIEYPTAPPISGRLYAANWSRVVNFGGTTNVDKNPDIDAITDWAEFDSNGAVKDQNDAGQWIERHTWPRDYTLDPTYLFFTQDPPIFYTTEAISYIHPKTNEIHLVPNDDIVWKLDGKEVHRGWFLELGALSETVTKLPGADTVLSPRIITVEFHNKEGFISEETKYAAINSDDADTLAAVDISEVDNFTSTLEGRFSIDEDTHGVIWNDDPRYDARAMYARFQWKDIGKGESPVRKFKKGKAKIKVDGVTIFNKKAIELDGQRSAFGEFWNDYLGPAFAVLGTAVALLSGPIAASLVTGLVLKNKDGFIGLFNDKGEPLDDNRPLAERGVTDWTDGRPSALLYTNEDNDEWNALLEFKKKPGPFTIEVDYQFNFRSGFLNLGKKWTRKYNMKKEYIAGELHLDIPLQPIDLGLFTVAYKDERR